MSPLAVLVLLVVGCAAATAAGRGQAAPRRDEPEDVSDVQPADDAAPGATPSKDYAEAIRLSLLFYYAQRSGQLPATNPILWRNDSALNDCVVGGWYDAGDHVKFGFPLAAALMNLVWGAVQFKQGYAASKQTHALHDTLRWGLNYLMNAWDPFTQEFVIQVGDGDIDHQFWGRPEVMNMSRPCIKAKPGKPASDIAGESAAALAAGAIVFRDSGSHGYAEQLLETAESLYAFAKANRGLYTDNPPAPLTQWYYQSNDDKDELCEAGVWLSKATGINQYLVDAIGEHESSLPVEFSWNDKRAACQLLLFEETKNATYKNEVKNFLASWKPGGTKTYTPCGLAWGNATYWGSARHVSNVAFLALVAADDGINQAENRKWAAEQIDYLLGDNSHDGGCFSFEIGYGHKYPLQPHHRAASCPAPPAPCGQSALDSPLASPHVLLGGLVGGPIANDGYNDTRADYVHNEVALDYNAGFQSALAGLSELVSKGHFPVTNNSCPCTQRFTGSHAPILVG